MTRVHESTKSCAVTGRLTGAWNVTPVRRWKIHVCASLDSHDSAMPALVVSTPSSSTQRVRPSNTWCATWRPEESWASSGSMDTGSPGSG